MKKLWILLLLVLLLSGCGAAETFENVEDVYSLQEQQMPKSITFAVPVDASSQVMEGEYGKLYFCDGYEIMVQTMESGDLNRTLHALTGYSKEDLTVMQTATADVDRYDCVWLTAGEAGDHIGRTAILDDGTHHYCLSVIAMAHEAGSLQNSWNELFSSIQLQS